MVNSVTTPIKYVAAVRLAFRPSFIPAQSVKCDGMETEPARPSVGGIPYAGPSHIREEIVRTRYHQPGHAGMDAGPSSGTNRQSPPRQGVDGRTR